MAADLPASRAALPADFAAFVTFVTAAVAADFVCLALPAARLRCRVAAAFLAEACLWALVCATVISFFGYRAPIPGMQALISPDREDVPRVTKLSRLQATCASGRPILPSDGARTRSLDR